MPYRELVIVDTIHATMDKIIIIINMIIIVCTGLSLISLPRTKWFFLYNNIIYVFVKGGVNIIIPFVKKGPRKISIFEFSIIKQVSIINF